MTTCHSSVVQVESAVKADNKICIVGSGHVAHHMAHGFHAAGLEIVQVSSRNATTGRELAASVQSRYSNSYEVHHSVDVVIIAVSDDAIREVSADLSVAGTTVIVHTSGVKPISEIASPAAKGAIWPVYSIRKEQSIDWNKVPFVISAQDTEVEDTLEGLCRVLSDQVIRVPESARAHLHIAAVFSNNFTTVLYGLAYDYCQKHNVPFDTLVPLIRQGLEKIAFENPGDLITGPAARGDLSTVAKHEEMLSGHPTHREVYRYLTSLILFQ
ncbi:MAG: DUF2520 domain-containing protein [Bacteroidota bacterium]